MDEFDERGRVQAWHLRDHGRDLLVEAWVQGGRNHARLLVDGTERATGDADAIGDVWLTDDDRPVKVAFWWRGRIASCELREAQGEDVDPTEGWSPMSRLRVHRVPFTPPANTRAARRHAWREEHPRLWATRHVVIQVVTILAAVLGISALLSALLGKLVPAIDWSWLPDVTVPEWLKYLNPSYWIGRILPDWDWFGWIPDWDMPDLGWLKYVVILGIAVATAIQEVRRRRAREERESTDADPEGPELSP